MLRRTVRLGLLVLAFSVSLSGAAAGHEDHDALGAGPGRAADGQAAERRSGPMEGANMRVQDMPTSGQNIAGDDMEGMHHEAAAENKTLLQRLSSWLGRVHPMVVHFPIAMTLGAFGVELFGLARRDRAYAEAARIMLMVGALGAVAAASLGWFAGGFYLSDRNPVLMTHRWLGTSIALASLALLFAAHAARRRPDRPRTLYWGLLGGLVVAISIQGWLGGSFMHGGLDHLAF